MASDCFFKLKNITDILAFEHSEDLHAVFRREGVLRRTVQAVWGWPGHLFLALEGGSLIKAYQVKGALAVKQFSILAKISPVVSICFTHDTHDVILVIHENGLVKVFEHCQPLDSHTQPWRKRAQLILGTYTNTARVKSALYSSCEGGGGRLVWVEERREMTQGGSESVHYSLLTAELEPYCKSLKNPSELLSGCPTTLHMAASLSAHSVAVLPSQPSPAGLYFNLHMNQSDERPLELATSIVAQGCVRRDTSFPVNFIEHADSLAHIWSKAAEREDSVLVAMAMEVGLGHLLLISEDGTVHISSEEGETQGVLSLSACQPASAAGWFAHRFVLGAVFPQDHVIKMYSMTSGSLLQEIDLSPVTSAEVIHTWCMMGEVPQSGVWTKDGIWLLQMHDASEVAKADEASAAEHLVSLGHGKMAAVMQLQRAHSHLSRQPQEEGQGEGEGAVGEGPCLDALHDRDIFQNNALLISLLQGLDESRRAEFAEKLCELEEEHEAGQADTGLNETMMPLLQDYWRIQQHRHQAARSETAAGGGSLTVTHEVTEALSEDSAIPLDLRLDRLELLSQLFPERVLHCLLQELDIEKAMETESVLVDGSPAAEQPSSSLRHASLCTAETDEGCRFLRLLCRLLFLHQPSKLLDVLTFLQRCHQGASDTSAFTRRRRVLSLPGIILDTLPDPTQSTDTKQAALAKAQLIKASGRDHGSMRALRLLLSHSLWGDAVGVVRGQDPSDSQEHRQLFHVLLSAMLTDSAALQTYSQQLWACIPQSISSLNLLQTLQVKHDSMQSQISLPQAMQGQGLTTAILKEQLHRMLAPESA